MTLRRLTGEKCVQLTTCVRRCCARLARSSFVTVVWSLNLHKSQENQVLQIHKKALISITARASCLRWHLISLRFLRQTFRQ